MTEEKPRILDEISELLSQQKLVPFFGAGLSRQHLGFAAAELAWELADLLGQPHETPLADLTDQYEDQYGREACVQFLREKLEILELDDAKAPIYRLLISLSSNLLYTTNQDNIFELTAEHYGRPYRRIVTLEDLSNAMPGEALLVKFHGDLGTPSSLIFGSRSYRQRIAAKDHPLDIKLRADLLGKRILFIGYSLKDENITKLIEAVKNAFCGQMPPSYLLAFEYDPSMEALNKDYGVQVVDPLKFTEQPVSPTNAFEWVLKRICDRTIQYQAQRGLENLFKSDRINPRLITEYELSALEKAIESKPFEEIVTAFRGLLDKTQVPSSLLERVTQTLYRLTELVNPNNDDQISSLRAALFNVHLPAQNAVAGVAGLMEACNRRAPQNGFDDLAVIQCPSLPDGFLPVAAALAVAKLREKKESISHNFRVLAQSWFQDYEDLPLQLKETVKTIITEVWPDTNAFDSPLNRPRLPIRRKGFHEIKKELLDKLPARLKRPSD